MNDQAFELLIERLSDIKEDISELRDQLNEYKSLNDEKVTKLRIYLGKLAVLASITGFAGGYGGSEAKEKMTPYFKNENKEIIKTIQKEN